MLHLSPDEVDDGSLSSPPRSLFRTGAASAGEFRELGGKVLELFSSELHLWFLCGH